MIDIDRKVLWVREELCNKIADRLLLTIIERELPLAIATIIYNAAIIKITRREALRRQEEFERRNEKYLITYRRNLRRRFSEMEQEVLAKVKASYQEYNKWLFDRRKEAKQDFDVNRWLFNRQKWQGTLTNDGKVLTAKPLTVGGQAMLDDLAVGMHFDEADARVIKWIATNSKNAGWKITKTAYEKLRKELMEGMAEGESIPKIRNRVMEVFKASKARATKIARTEVLKASNRGSLIGMHQSGVVEGKQWLATMGPRTCSACEEMDGVTMGIDKPFFEKDVPQTIGGIDMPFDYEEIQHPPLHVSCRCTIISILKET